MEEKIPTVNYRKANNDFFEEAIIGLTMKHKIELEYT